MRRPTIVAASLTMCAASLAAQVRRDSAGVQIVESRTPALTGARAWRVDPKAALTIGDPKAATEGDSLYEFGRVMGLTRLATGHWAVALPTSIRIYDAGGKYQRTIGRVGDGPGEFRQIMGLHPIRGDTLVLTDNGEVEYYAPDGKFIGQGASRRTTPGTYVWPSSVLDDGTYIGLNFNDRSMTPPAGRQVRRLPLYRVSRDGKRLDTLATVSGGEMVFDGRSPYGNQVVYTAGPMIATSGARVLYSYPERAEVTEFTNEGRVTRVIRLPLAVRPVTTADQDEYKKWMLDMPGEDGRPVPPQLRAQRERIISTGGFAATFPIYSLILADRGGNLWLRRFDIAQQRYKPGPVMTITTASPSSWDVIDANGRWICTLETPPHFTPREIGGDYVAGIAHDADDVEMIKVFRIVKP